MQINQKWYKLFNLGRGQMLYLGTHAVFTEISDHGSQMASKIFGKISKYFVVYYTTKYIVDKKFNAST